MEKMLEIQVSPLQFGILAQGLPVTRVCSAGVETLTPTEVEAYGGIVCSSRVACDDGSTLTGMALVWAEGCDERGELP